MESLKDLDKKLDERGLKPTSFIDGSYSQEFLMFFFSDTLFQWNSEIFDENNHVILTRIGKDEETGHYAVIWGRPRMERWSVIGENSTTSFLLGYSDADVVVGKYNSNNQPVPCNSFNLEGLSSESIHLNICIGLLPLEFPF